MALRPMKPTSIANGIAPATRRPARTLPSVEQEADDDDERALAEVLRDRLEDAVDESARS